MATDIDQLAAEIRDDLREIRSLVNKICERIFGNGGREGLVVDVDRLKQANEDSRRRESRWARLWIPVISAVIGASVAGGIALIGELAGG